MTEEVCKLIASEIEALNLEYLDRVEGAVTRAKIKHNDKEVYFPFAHGVDTCDYDHAVVPDEKLKSVLWMEPGAAGIAPGANAAMIGAFTVRVRVVCWLNLRKLGTRNRDLTTQIERDFIEHMKGLRSQNSQVRVVGINFEQVAAKNIGEVFGRYSFKDEVQWHFGKYDYFAHDYQVRFTANCSPTINAEVC